MLDYLCDVEAASVCQESQDQEHKEEGGREGELPIAAMVSMQ